MAAAMAGGKSRKKVSSGWGLSSQIKQWSGQRGGGSGSSSSSSSSSSNDDEKRLICSSTQ